MRRTALLYLLPAAAIAANWVRLEEPRAAGGTLAAVCALALAPALFPGVALRVAAAAVAALVAARVAFGVSALDARPFDSHHAFFGPLASRFENGFLDFYDYALPIDPRLHAWMHGVVLVAVFGFCLAVGLAVAARRPLLAAFLLLVGAGWPATLLAGGHDIQRGGFILLALLVLLAGLGAHGPDALPRALLPVAGVLAAAVVAAGFPAVAKPQFLSWQHWDFYNRPQQPVDVSYVWNSNYTGITFPRKKTTVLEIDAPPTSIYWRATTLDSFVGGAWLDSLRPSGGSSALEPLERIATRHANGWIKADVTVKALRDTHLVGGSEPVQYEAGNLPILYLEDGVAVLAPGFTRDEHYTAWSYAPHPTPAQLARSRPDYPPQIAQGGHYLEVQGAQSVPPFGTPNRDARMRSIFRSYSGDSALRPYLPLYAKARDIAGGATTPYAAVISLETWFRKTGGFVYSQHPPLVPGVPPLVAFVLKTKTGYCQHYAGAMALMTRFLGVPARVAAGFTSGTYDVRNHRWIVSDRDAHTWVEIWFKGYGWLPFDPTPGRGRLSAPYSASSAGFDLRATATLLGRTSSGEDVFDVKMDRDLAERNVKDRTPRTAADVPRGVRFPDAGSGRSGSLLKLLALVAAGVAAAIALAKLGLRRARYVTRDPRRLAGACRRELAGFLLDQRVPLPESATLQELGEIVRAELAVEPRYFVDAAAAARYGPAAGAVEAASRARRELRQLEREISRRLSPLDRLRGLLSLRSLGFA